MTDYKAEEGVSIPERLRDKVYNSKGELTDLGKMYVAGYIEGFKAGRFEGI